MMMAPTSLVLCLLASAANAKLSVDNGTLLFNGTRAFLNGVNQVCK